VEGGNIMNDYWKFDPHYINPIKGGDSGGRDTTAFLVEGKLICATCMRNVSEYYEKPMTYVRNPYYRNMVNVAGYQLCSSCGCRFGEANGNLEKFLEDYNYVSSLSPEAIADLMTDTVEIKLGKIKSYNEIGEKLATKMLGKVKEGFIFRLNFEDTEMTIDFFIDFFKILLKHYTVKDLDRILTYKNTTKHIDNMKNLVIKHIVEYKNRPERAKIIREILSRIIEE